MDDAQLAAIGSLPYVDQEYNDPGMEKLARHSALVMRVLFGFMQEVARAGGALLGPRHAQDSQPDVRT